MKLWITGAKGLLGSALLEKTEAVGTGHSEVDIADLNAVCVFAKKQRITHIVNCAAFSLVDLAESRREEAYKANAIGPENLGIAAKEVGAKLIHISTDYVFPGDLRRPLRETDATGPCSYYGETKLEGEERLQKINPSACILRTSWIFGRGGKNFVSKLLDLLQEPKAIQLTDDQWGRPTYAPDLAEVILKLLDRPVDLSGIYQFANEGAATKYEFALAMREEALKLGFPVRAEAIVPVPGAIFPSPCKRPQYSVFDTTKIEQELRIQIRPWREALREFLCTQSVLSPIS